jgi:hypothetical protein
LASGNAHLRSFFALSKKNNAMENLPLYISIVLTLTTLVSIWSFFKASQNSKLVLAILSVWLMIQGVLGFTGFYTVTDTVPPRFILLIGPPILFIIALFVTPKGKKFIDGLDTKYMTALHIVRIPVEIVLFWLFLHKAVPELMTFEGRNPDIFSGITAAIIVMAWAFKRNIGARVLMLWNFICLALLFNIVINAILAAPSRFQQFAFDQPNIAVLHFPFIWLPCCIVPLVLLSHLASIRQLLTRQSKFPAARKHADNFHTLEKQ